VPKCRQRSILSIRWHWPTLTAFGPFWTVARHRMAIVPGDQFALWAPAGPGGFHALGSVTAGAEEVPDKGPCWPDPAEGERLTSYGPLGCCYLARRSFRLSILCDYHHRAYLRPTQIARVAGPPTAVHADRTVRLNDPAGDRSGERLPVAFRWIASGVFTGLHSAGRWCLLSSRPGFESLQTRYLRKRRCDGQHSAAATTASGPARAGRIQCITTVGAGRRWPVSNRGS